MSEAIDFSDLLLHRNYGYVPRPDLEAEIEALINDATHNCILILGEPGSGKTALATHLVQKLTCLHHFLRPGHTEFTLWRDPYAFLTSVAFQLKGLFGEAIFPAALAIDVKGQIHTVEESGRFTGIDIGRLITLPWREERLNVAIETQRVKGQVTGVQISEMIADYRNVPLTAFREMALLEPLRRIKQLNQQARLVLWVDGLDEESIAHLDNSDSQDYQIASLLPLGSELKSIGNACIVISTRPGMHIDRFQRDGAQIIRLEAAEFEKDRQACLSLIVNQELENEATVQLVIDAGWDKDSFSDHVLQQSEGNPLYVRQLFRALNDPVQGYVFSASAKIPLGLQAIQRDLLTRLLPSRHKATHQETYRILEILSVAFDPLSSEQLAGVAGLPMDRVTEALGRLASILEDDGHQSRIALYHSSVREVVTDPANRGTPWGVDPGTAHGLIGIYYHPPEQETFNLSDNYGTRYGTSHLALAGKEERIRLIYLMNSDWRAHVRALSSSSYPFMMDLERAWGAMSPEMGIGYFDRCLLTCRLGLIYGFVQDAMTELSPDTLELMVRLGQFQLALDSLHTGETGVQAARRCRAILKGLAAQDFADIAVAEDIMCQAMKHLEAPGVRGWYFWELAELLTLCTPGTMPATAEILEALEPSIKGKSVTEQTTWALAEYARLWSAFEPEAADFYFQQALVYADQADRFGKVRLAQYWRQFDPQTAQAQLVEAFQEAERDQTAENEASGNRDTLGTDLATAWNQLLGHQGSSLPPVSVATVVKAQLEDDPDFLEAYAKALPDQAIKGQVCREAARYYLDKDVAQARHYLEQARITEEFPRSSGPVRHFYFALAHQIEPDDYERGAQMLMEVDVNATAQAMWRRSMIDRFLPVRPDKAWDLFSQELIIWGNNPLNHYDAEALPAKLAQWPDEWTEQAADLLDNLSETTQRRLLCGTLARHYQDNEPEKAQAYLSQALDSGTSDEKHRLSEWELLAFIAGQRWQAGDGKAILAQALKQLDNTIQLDDTQSDPIKYDRSLSLYRTQLSFMAKRLRQGNIQAALALLKPMANLGKREYSEEMVFPYAGIEKHRIAGMDFDEYIVGSTLGALASHDPQILQNWPEDRFGPAVRSFARSYAVLNSDQTELPQKLSWCQEALAFAGEVPLPPLRRLLMADAACAFQCLGVDKKALELARILVQEILASRDFQIMKSMYGHAWALACCYEILVETNQLDESIQLLWNARIMGAGGYYVLMSTLPNTLSRLGHIPTQIWETIELGAFQVYPRQ